MGQKTHPLGFRLGINQEQQSKWYAHFDQYPNILKEDDKIRTYFNSISKTNFISHITINRNIKNNQITLNIETGKPEILVEDSGMKLESLLTNIKKFLPADRQLVININEVEIIDLNASLLADLVVSHLEKRVSFRRAIRDVLQRAKNQNVNGIKIQVSGRLNGVEMARSEWVREGRVPLHTLRANIDYATKEANTIYGILGIKIWLFKSEILTK